MKPEKNKQVSRTTTGIFVFSESECVVRHKNAHEHNGDDNDEDDDDDVLLRKREDKR